MDTSTEPKHDHDVSAQARSQAPGHGGASTNRTQYEVGPVEPATATRPRGITAPTVAAAPIKRVAVFVAHGMGQQIPFQTLDQVAEGLRLQDSVHHPAVKSDVRSVKFEDQWLQRIELHLRSGTANPVEAHVYEGYWAPLTEGKITARTIMGFLASAGRNGIENGSHDFYRWLFGSYTRFDSPIRIVLYLLIALLTVAALVAMNSAIALVAAGRALLADTPAWLSKGLFADLTTTFNVVVTIMAVFGASLGLAYGLRRLRAPALTRLAWGWLTVILFIVVLFVVVLAGLSLPLLFYGHLRSKTADSVQLWHLLFPAAQVDGFNVTFNTWALWLAVGVGTLFAAWWVVKVAWGVLGDLLHRRDRLLTLLVTVCFGALIVFAVRLGLSFLGVFRGFATNEAGAVVSGGLAWPLLIAVSAFIRQVLVQYVGDVAIYVAPYKLDAFFQLRDQIKNCVQKVAYAVYAQQREDGSGPEYDQVFVVGHSLGSVIVYDVLNRLVNEDEAAGRSLRVVDRTSLLLTFGSPLDKTAFVFAVQGRDTHEAREALAASVQPLIRDYNFRPKRWINIYSPWDIISGDLGFYDPPGGADPKRVQNEVDPDATTLLAAHVEYWSNSLLFKTLYEAL
jgi:hypothetical protein